MRLTVRVKPGVSKPGVATEPDGSLTVRVAARAVDGAANEAVVAALAAHFRVPRSRVTIVRGRTARTKLVDVPLSFQDGWHRKRIGMWPLIRTSPELREPLQPRTPRSS